MTHKSLEEIEAERLVWSLKTFPEATALSSLKKARVEVMEAVDALIEHTQAGGSKDHLAEEYVDALMCIFDSAARAGIFIGDLREAFAKKLEKNKARKWKKNLDDTYSHVKEGSVNG